MAGTKLLILTVLGDIVGSLFDTAAANPTGAARAPPLKKAIRCPGVIAMSAGFTADAVIMSICILPPIIPPTTGLTIPAVIGFVPGAGGMSVSMTDAVVLLLSGTVAAACPWKKIGND